MIPSIIKFFSGKSRNFHQPVLPKVNTEIPDGLTRYYDDDIQPSVVTATDPRYSVVQKENSISGYDPETETARNIFISPNGQRDTSIVFSSPNRDRSVELGSPYKNVNALPVNEWDRINKYHDQKMSEWSRNPNRKMWY